MLSNILRFICFSLVLSIHSLLVSQEPTETKSVAESEKKEKSSSKNLTDTASIYSPSFYSLSAVDAEIEKQDYATVKKIIQDVEEEYLRRLVKIMTNTVIHHNKKLKFRGANADHEFKSSQNYFDTVAISIKNSHHLLTSIKLMDDADEKFKIIRDALVAQDVTDKELKETDYKLNLLKGILYMYRADSRNIKLAIDHFEYILMDDRNERREPLIDDVNKIMQVYDYLVGCYHELSKVSVADRVMYAHYLRNELYYLWLLIDAKNDNQKLKDYKFRKLVRDYYKVIDFKGARYANYYKPYLEEIGVKYEGLEEKLKAKKVAGAEATTKQDAKKTASENEAAPATQAQ